MSMRTNEQQIAAMQSLALLTENVYDQCVSLHLRYPMFARVYVSMLTCLMFAMVYVCALSDTSMHRPIPQLTNKPPTFPNTHRSIVFNWLCCLCCGLQNGLTSKYSGNAVRTTHLTGATTDLVRVLLWLR